MPDPSCPRREPTSLERSCCIDRMLQKPLDFKTGQGGFRIQQVTDGPDARSHPGSRGTGLCGRVNADHGIRGDDLTIVQCRHDLRRVRIQQDLK